MITLTLELKQNISRIHIQNNRDFFVHHLLTDKQLVVDEPNVPVLHTGVLDSQIYMNRVCSIAIEEIVCFFSHKTYFHCEGTHYALTGCLSNAHGVSITDHMIRNYSLYFGTKA